MIGVVPPELQRVLHCLFKGNMPMRHPTGLPINNRFQLRPDSGRGQERPVGYSVKSGSVFDTSSIRDAPQAAELHPSCPPYGNLPPAAAEPRQPPGRSSGRGVDAEG